MKKKELYLLVRFEVKCVVPMIKKRGQKTNVYLSGTLLHWKDIDFISGDKSRHIIYKKAEKIMSEYKFETDLKS